MAVDKALIMRKTPNITFFHQLASLAEHRLLSPQAIQTFGHSDTSSQTEFLLSQEIINELRERIQNVYPQHCIMTNAESSENTQSQYTWTIRHFHSQIDDIPVSGIFLGFTDKGKNSMCMLTHPFTRERFWTDGIKSRVFGPLGEFTLATRQINRLDQAVVHINIDSAAKNISVVKIKNKALLTRKGDPFYAIEMLAAGYIDICIISTSHIQEFIPFIQLLENAGGVFNILNENNDGQENMLIASGSRKLHSEVMNIITSAD